jgi:hypothetical protein
MLLHVTSSSLYSGPVKIIYCKSDDILTRFGYPAAWQGISKVTNLVIGDLDFNSKRRNNLRIFERQILREIFGPVNIDSIWRIRNNMEIDKLIEGTDIVRYIKAQRIKCLRHIQRMDQARPTRKLFDWKPMGTRPVGRPRQRPLGLVVSKFIYNTLLGILKRMLRKI